MRPAPSRAWNDTARPYRTDLLVHQRFEEHVTRAPDAVAVLCRGEAWSYARLNARANRIAHHLRSLGVGPGHFVGVCLHRSADLVAAVLAVLKAGAAYVPFDPDHPAARLAFLSDDAGIRVVLTATDAAQALPASPVRVLLDTADESLAAASAEDLACDADIDSLAYLIYTSGSTGEPKGVLVHHRSVLNLIDWVNGTFGVSPNDRLLAVASSCFDLSVYDIFGILAAGGSLHVATREELRSPRALVQALRSGGITFWDSAPATLAQLAPLFPDAARDSRLRLVFLSGDWVPLALPDQVKRAFPRAEVVALGGATEATVWSNWFRVGHVDPAWKSIPYGRPIANARYYILDGDLAPVPVGEEGELYIGGVCVAAGYHARPQLDAQAFLPDPFVPDDGTRLYRTGDRARWFPDGNIEFLGRRDEQVKIRGFRIELAEIGAALTRIPGVREGLALARSDRGDTERELVAYFVRDDSAARPDAAAIDAALRSALPAYMVPAHVVELDAFPVTGNGKIDRRALPAPVRRSAAAFVAPRNATESALAELFGELLGVDRVGVEDDFFRLGGNSLLAAQLIARVCDRFDCDLDLAAIAASPTIAGLTPRIRPGQRADRGPGPRTAALRLPMTSTQERIFYLWEIGSEPALYNVGCALDVEGPLDEGALRAALATLVTRHEILRTTFGRDAAGGVQHVHQGGELPLTVQRCAAAGFAIATKAEAARPFDLRGGPCTRAVLLRADDGRARLVLTQHHLLTDEWSLAVLLEELVAQYAIEAGGRGDALPPVAVQFADHALWQRSRSFATDVEFFVRELAGTPRVLDLPYDHARPAQPAHRGRVASTTLEHAVVERLQSFARAEGATPFVVFLAALDALLHRITGAPGVLVGTPVAGRTHAQVERTLGFFANTLVVRADLSGKPGFRTLVERVRGAVRRAWTHQEAPFDEVARRALKEGATITAPQVLLILRNEPPLTLTAGATVFHERLVFTDTARFDLTFVVVPLVQGAEVHVEYDADLFEEATVARMLGGYRDLLASALAQPDAPVATLPLPSGLARTRHALGFRVEIAGSAAPGSPAEFELREATGEDPVLFARVGRDVDLDELRRHVLRTFTTSLQGPVAAVREPEREDFREPQDEIERALVGIWEDLLGASPIGTLDDFFDLGGHSLLALRMAGRIEERFGIAPPVRTLLQHPTIVAIAGWLGKRVAAPDPAAGIVRVDRGVPQVLSFSQEQVWILEQLAPGNGAYHIPVVLSVEGALDRDALQQALDAIVARHESLRTVFLHRDGIPMQRVLPSLAVRVEAIDAGADPDAALAAFVQRPFDLLHGPLLRLAILSRSETDHVLCFTVHHIVADGWSVEVLRQEFFDFYCCRLNGEPAVREPLAVHAVDLAVFERKQAEGAAAAESLRYWREQLAGAPEVIALPLDRPRPPKPSYRGGRLPLDLPRDAATRFVAVCRESGVSVFVGGLAAWQLLLARYTRDDDVVVGSPFALRDRRESQQLIADAINTVVLRTSLAGNPTGRELMQRVRATTNAAFEHARLPFERLVQELHPHRRGGYNPLFQVLFGMEPPLTPIAVPGVKIGNRWFDPGRSQLELSLYVRETAAGIGGDLYFSSDVFERESAARLLRHYASILRALAEDPDQPIDAIGLLDEREEERVLVDWNATLAEFPAERCIHELFEARARSAPDDPAVCVPQNGELPGVRLTYRELNAAANQLARLLQRRGVGPGDVVALSTDRGPAMLVGMLGILKAGAAYLPLDPGHPGQRFAWMVEDSGVRVLVTDRPADGSRAGLDEVCLETVRPALAAMGAEDLGVASSSEALAYVIYTSGSTGRPKGVAIRHRSVVNFLVAMAATPGCGPRDRLLAVTTLSFDIAVLELLLPLVTGACVVLARSEETPDGARLTALVAQEKISILQATPTTWRLMLEAGWQGAKGLKALCGGEPLPPELARALLPRCAELWNMYGPTETTVWSTVQRIRDAGERITIGRPIANTKAYILDRCLRPVPIGVPGELYIGGEGLARGYLNDPERTAAQFVDNPFRGGRSRLYRTGDLARFLADGRIECLGRLDTQVKLRGFRIELGEIESVLEQVDGIDEARVVVRTNGGTDQYLAAYVRGNPDVPVSQMRQHLRAHLPAYMMPRTYTWLDEFPLLPSGKVDRRALAALAADAAPRAVPDAASTELERALADLWSRALGVPRVSLHDDFFDLGGTSLLVLQVCAQVEAELGRKLLPAAFLEAPTVAGVARFLERDEASAATPANLTPLTSTGDQPPLFLFPGIGGHAFTFREIARVFADERPVHGAHLIGMAGGEPPLSRIEDMAERYITEILEVQPDGPILLAGYSAGGWIAFEIAVRLRKRGRTIGTLVLVDCDAPGYLTWGRLERAWFYFKLEFLRGGFRGRVRYIGDRVTRFVHRIGLALGLHTESAAELVTKGMWRALQGYRGEQLAADALLLRARVISHPTRFADPLFGWGKLIQGELTWKYIPGDHLTIWSPENVTALAEILAGHVRQNPRCSVRAP